MHPQQGQVIGYPRDIQNFIREAQLGLVSCPMSTNVRWCLWVQEWWKGRWVLYLIITQRSMWAWPSTAERQRRNEPTTLWVSCKFWDWMFDMETNTFYFCLYILFIHLCMHVHIYTFYLFSTFIEHLLHMSHCLKQKWHNDEGNSFSIKQLGR